MNEKDADKDRTRSDLPQHQDVKLQRASRKHNAILKVILGAACFIATFWLSCRYYCINLFSPGSHHQHSYTAQQQQQAPHFRLQHIYHRNTDKSRQIGRYNVANDDFMINTLGPPTLELKTINKTIRRMSNRDPDHVEGYLSYARKSKLSKAIELDWVDEVVPAPNVTDRDTILQLAYMCQDAYVDEPHTGDWLNVSAPWEGRTDFGWMGEGLRGHVFATGDNGTVVISLKGTSAAIFDSGGSTAPNDKVNDNLLFSCCCARISYLWNTVCDCYTGESYTCNQTCLEDQLYSQDRYFAAALDLYRNVSSQYPHSNIWMVGHSLGGALSAMVGRTYGVPALAFESPPELLATKRLHLPMPPGVPAWEDHVWHFGHTADPIYMGVCNGAGSSCWIGGYAMETKCHSGLTCVLDTVKEEGWYVSLVNHRILTVIHDLLEKRNTTAECKVPEPCQDCFDWKFVNPEEPPEPTGTTTTTQPPRITTKPISTHSSTASTTATTTTSTTSKRPQKCLERTWYGRCIKWGDADDPTSTTTTIMLTSTSPTPTRDPDDGKPHTCLGRTWYGRCTKYS